jgi:hypothetical protein
VQLGEVLLVGGDLAYLEHIIRNDAVLPAAGFDDCEHRFISFVFDPGLGQVRTGFFFSRYGFQFLRDRGAIPGSHAKTSGARNFPRRVAGLIARGSSKSRQSGLKTGQI